MVLQLVRLKSFVKDSSKVKLTDKHFTRFVEYVYLLSQEKILPAEYLDHTLTGEWEDFREFHISGDVLVIYRVEGELVKLVRIGSHSQLFG
ncbi:type II toxin-antitoxin system YafQ family toxin [uncultured Thiothrix sp.]|uniref:type II toxin-antitoxin system RelE/ParE family toxin n=1 Tax=uncultured Thiothrix sp. TaxID=223185 RepID=UPI00260A1C54|nr:type II toxin-antitoxin system YafQ family toxin [uncultured Thiothrix sp.]